MIKQDIITEVANATGQSEYTSRVIIEATIKLFTKVLQSHEDITLRGFGTFKVIERGARTARNIHTGEPIYMPARQVVTFEPGKDLQNI